MIGLKVKFRGQMSMNFGLRCFLQPCLHPGISIDNVTLSGEWTFHEVIFPLLSAYKGQTSISKVNALWQKKSLAHSSVTSVKIMYSDILTREERVNSATGMKIDQNSRAKVNELWLNKPLISTRHQQLMDLGAL